MTKYGKGFKFQIFMILFVSNAFEIKATTTSIRPSSLSIHSKDPHYRFHYLEKTGDYKAQEESRTDNLTRSYMLAEPNDDLKVLNYTTDTSSAFKSEINVQSETPPIKLGPFATSTMATALGPAFNNYYRMGISPPTKTYKPLRGLNPIVVKSLTLPSHLINPSSEHSQPYTFYKANNESSSGQPADNATFPTERSRELKSMSSTTAADAVTVTPSINSENKNDNLQPLSYFEQAIKSTNKVAMTTENISSRQLFTPSSNGLNQLHKMDIPSSILEILSQNKGFVFSNTATSTPFSDNGTLKPGTGMKNSIKIDTFSNKESRNDDSLLAVKDNIPQRPMRLIGLNPVYIPDSLFLHTVGENLTTPPHAHVDPFSILHYSAAKPSYQGPLPYPPPMPFRNIPRSVNELNAEPMLGPLINSIPISAPLLQQAVATSDMKSDSKPENKPMVSPFVICNDCLLPSNYPTYPLVRMPTAGSAPLPASAPSAPSPTFPAAPIPNDYMNNQKPPCPSNAAPSMPMWPSYPPSFAYVLLPTSMIKNNTRSLPVNIFS